MTDGPQEPLSDEDMTTEATPEQEFGDTGGGGGDADGTDGGDADGTDGGDSDGSDADGTDGTDGTDGLAP